MQYLLITGKVHNLGASGFVDALTECFAFRIGLSIAPIRQYNPDGTDKLVDCFGGPPVFEFSLGGAIRPGCLVPYRHCINVIQPDYEELTTWTGTGGFSYKYEKKHFTLCI